MQCDPTHPTRVSLLMFKMKGEEQTTGYPKTGYNSSTPWGDLKSLICTNPQFHLMGPGMPWDALGCPGMPWDALGCRWTMGSWSTAGDSPPVAAVSRVFHQSLPPQRLVGQSLSCEAWEGGHGWPDGWNIEGFQITDQEFGHKETWQFFMCILNATRTRQTTNFGSGFACSLFVSLSPPTAC